MTEILTSLFLLLIALAVTAHELTKFGKWLNTKKWFVEWRERIEKGAKK